MLFIWNFIVWDDSPWLEFILYSVSCRVGILLFLFPVYFSIDKDNRIIFWNNKGFLFEVESWICSNFDSWEESWLTGCLVGIVSTRWWKSVGEIWATNQRRPEDSEKYKYGARFTNHIRTEMKKWFFIFSHFYFWAHFCFIFS